MLLDFDILARIPKVTRLRVHLEDEQVARFRDSDIVADISAWHGKGRRLHLGLRLIPTTQKPPGGRNSTTPRIISRGPIRSEAGPLGERVEILSGMPYVRRVSDGGRAVLHPAHPDSDDWARVVRRSEDDSRRNLMRDI